MAYSLTRKPLLYKQPINRTNPSWTLCFFDQKHDTTHWYKACACPCWRAHHRTWKSQAPRHVKHHQLLGWQLLEAAPKPTTEGAAFQFVRNAMLFWKVCSDHWFFEHSLLFWNGRAVSWSTIASIPAQLAATKTPWTLNWLECSGSKFTMFGHLTHSHPPCSPCREYWQHGCPYDRFLNTMSYLFAELLCTSFFLFPSSTSLSVMVTTLFASWSRLLVVEGL